MVRRCRVRGGVERGSFYVTDEEYELDDFSIHGAASSWTKVSGVRNTIDGRVVVELRCSTGGISSGKGQRASTTFSCMRYALWCAVFGATRFIILVGALNHSPIPVVANVLLVSRVLPFVCLWHLSVTVRVVTRPGADLDGTTNVTFAVISGGPQASTSSSISLSRGNDDFGNPNSAAAYQGQAWTTAWPSQGGNHSTLEETLTTQAIDMVSFDVTYFHCGAGSFWNRTASSVDEGTDTCPLCTDGVEGETAVRDLECDR